MCGYTPVPLFFMLLHVRVLLHVKGANVAVVTKKIRDVWYKVESKFDCVVNLSVRSPLQFYYIPKVPSIERIWFYPFSPKLAGLVISPPILDARKVDAEYSLHVS